MTEEDLRSNEHPHSKVLAKFLKGDWDIDFEGEDFMVDKLLLEFPVFPLNEDYIRALVNIIFTKLDSAQNLYKKKKHLLSVRVKEHAVEPEQVEQHL